MRIWFDRRPIGFAEYLVPADIIGRHPVAERPGRGRPGSALGPTSDATTVSSSACRTQGRLTNPRHNFGDIVIRANPRWISAADS